VAEDEFGSTHWSAVMQASGDSAEARRALAELCETYWFPLYAYLRRRYAPEEAEDLTQEFFAREVLTRRIFKGVDPLHGRFRAWLLASLKHLVANAVDARDAAKRGGGAQHVAIDQAAAEARYQLANTAALTPEQLYERTWALMLLERARAALRRQYEASGRGALFAAIEGGLPGAAPARPGADVARELGKSEEAVRVAVHRLRKEFGDLLREEVGRTVCSAEDVDAELRDLLAAFG
jgi:DNA-directed RNA polymerase specialized sigma24 family protein